MRIAVVEDNEEFRNTLVGHLEELSKEINMTFVVDAFENGFIFLEHFHSNYDTIYLDVQMPHLDGMQVASEIRRLDNIVNIVFVTNYVQWAIDGYAVNALDFLLKPLTYFNFKEHFNKILSKQTQRTTNYITLKTPAGVKKIDLNELLYIESEGHYLCFHLLEESFSILETMKAMEELLTPHDFYRCNNSYIVNLKYVKGIEKNLVTVGDTKLTVSRPRRKDFLETLSNYISENQF